MATFASVRYTVFIFLALLSVTQRAAADDTSFSINTRSGITQSFIANILTSPLPVVVLFPGGDGSFITESYPGGSISVENQNFLIRTRRIFNAANIGTVLVKTPSDHLNGIDETLRKNAKHIQDIAAVLGWIKQHTNAPVWLVCTSMDSISAAANTIALQNKIAGVILT